MFYRLVQPGAEQRQRRQLREVFADADGFGIELKQLHLLGIGGGAQDESDRSFLATRAFVFVQPPQV